MAALTILIIRHGEKPGDVTPPAGVTPDGVQDGRSLLVRGWQRAGAWAALFGAGLGGASYPAPGIIYACRPDPSPASDDDPPSQRPFETITPLADALRLVPRLTFGQDEGEDLASEVAALSGVVLIAWEHKRITGVIVPALLRGAGAGRRTAEMGSHALRRRPAVRSARIGRAMVLPADVSRACWPAIPTLPCLSRRVVAAPSDHRGHPCRFS